MVLALFQKACEFGLKISIGKLGLWEYKSNMAEVWTTVKIDAYSTLNK